jgi:hypothetical protein
MTHSNAIAERDAFGPQPVTAAYKLDISRGERIGRVSSEWFSRPDDERYLSLSALYAAVRARADRATASTVESRAIRVEASRDDAERLALIVPGREEPIAPTHWSFGQMRGLVGARQLYAPAPRAACRNQLAARTALHRSWTLQLCFGRLCRIRWQGTRKPSGISPSYPICQAARPSTDPALARRCPKIGLLRKRGLIVP